MLNLSETNNRLLLNADLGEGHSTDQALMPMLDMASIACGGHAGSKQSMRASVSLALDHDVVVGAHPSYNDKDNFGRRSLLGALDINIVAKNLLTQVNTLAVICHELGGKLAFVKPHGALYHDLTQSQTLAKIFAQCLFEYDPALKIVGFPSGCLASETRNLQMHYLAESFADRRYDSKGQLIARDQNQQRPLLTTPEEVSSQVEHLMQGYAVSASGKKIAVRSNTICIHGDTTGAVKLAKAARQSLNKFIH